MPKKILIIEDDPAQVLMLQLRLREEGFEVLSATDGKEGLRKAAEETPDLILLDVVLPGMSGIDVCIALKDDPRAKEIPVLLLTASAMRGLEDRVKTFGVAGCLVKPYEMSQLLEMIGAILQT